ncbi:hypothetical protein [Corynebacterium antarcticum]|uniref:hypothetical protein n=1 Tax=Corynebacterium antarcticum TaxID=2800405 RepID=UPI002005A91E|nr:hypothetical protein [Corynebacterium antarcticum]MCK7661300.1 hypothetical protein [Corynebacterium antarcticum]
MRDTDRTNPYNYPTVPDDEHGWLYAWERLCAPEGSEPSKFYSSSDMLSFADGYITALEDLGYRTPDLKPGVMGTEETTLYDLEARTKTITTDTYNTEGRVIDTKTTTEPMEAN